MTKEEQRAAYRRARGLPVDPATQAKVEEAEDDRIVQQGFTGGGGGGGGSDLGDAAAGSNRVRDDLGVTYSADSGDLDPFEDLDLSDPKGIAEAQANDIDLQATAPPIPGPDRMPAKNRKAQLLTDVDLRSLAESGEYPTDFMGEDYYINPRQPTESALAYSQIESPYEREAFLRNRKDYLLKQRKEKEARDYRLQHPATAYAAGGAVGLTGGLMAGVSLAGGVLGAIAKGVGPFATYLVEAGVPLAKLGGSSYIIKTLYNDIMSDSGITEEEAQQKIQQEVQKQLQIQKDSGSPAVSEGTKDTGTRVR